MAFPNTTFLSRVTVITATWLQAVNDFIVNFQQLGGPTDYVFGPPTYATDTTGVANQSGLLSSFTSGVTSGTIDSYFNYSQYAVIPAGNYRIDTVWTMPQKVTMSGKFTGAGTTKSVSNFARYTDLVCATGHLASGLFNSTYDGIYGPLTVDGGGSGKGTLWSRFANGITGNWTINTSNFSVNFNVFGPYHGGTIDIADGSGTGQVDCHANLFYMTDVTGATGGLTKTSTLKQTNWSLGSYVESGADITNPDLHCIFFHGDTFYPPRVRKTNWAIGSTNIIERNRKDRMPYGGQNLLAGGDWDVVSLDARVGGTIYFPACYLGFGGATPSIVVDTTEPSRVGKYLSWALGNTDGLTIYIPKSPAVADGASSVVAVGLFVYWRGTMPTSVSVLRPDATTTDYGWAGVDVDGTWKSTYLSLYASTTGDTQVILTFASGGTFGIGGAFATNEKVARLPQARSDLVVNTPTANGYSIRVHDKLEQGGVKTLADTAASGNIIDVAVTFNTAFSAVPKGIVGKVTYSIVSLDDTLALNVTRHFIKKDSLTTTGFVVRFYLSGATLHLTTDIHWDAVGPR